MANLRDGKFVWVTWLSKLIAGEVKCEWGCWFKTHYRGWARTPGDYQLAQWQAEHTQVLSALVAERSGLGERVLKEDQNRFKVKMTPTLILAGKPDLIAISLQGDRTVYDTKTGRPRQSDLIQVMLYMLCLPTALAMHKGNGFSGCVVYRNGDRSHIPSHAISEDFKKNTRYFINLLDHSDAPRRTPSSQECRYCDITAADCPERCGSVTDSGDEETPLLNW